MVDVGCGRGEFLDLLTGPASRPAAWTTITRWWRAAGPAASTWPRPMACRSCWRRRLAASAVSSPRRWSSTSSRTTCCGSCGGRRRAAPGRANRARDHQSRMLERVLRELYPRPHARAARASGDVKFLVIAAGFSGCRGAVALGLPGRRQAGAPARRVARRAGGARTAAVRGYRGPQRRPSEQPLLHVSRLCRGRPAPVMAARWVVAASALVRADRQRPAAPGQRAAGVAHADAAGGGPARARRGPGSTVPLLVLLAVAPLWQAGRAWRPDRPIHNC